MAREYFIFGQTLCKVTFSDGKSYELALPVPNGISLHIENGITNIVMTIPHFDMDVLQKCIKENNLISLSLHGAVKNEVWLFRNSKLLTSVIPLGAERSIVSLTWQNKGLPEISES